MVYSLTSTNSNPLIGGTGVTKVSVSSGTGSFSTAVTGLTTGTGYSFNVYATNVNGSTYGSAATFSTLSTNANLSNLVLSTGALSPAFSAATTTYTQTVGNEVSLFSLTATGEKSPYSIQYTINGGTSWFVESGVPSSSHPLPVGTNTVEVKVTAQDRVTTKIYTVALTRSSVQPDQNFQFGGALLSIGPDGAQLERCGSGRDCERGAPRSH